MRADFSDEKSEARTADGLSGDELQRYGRQMSLSEIGYEGQFRLKQSRVLIVGAGGLGSPVALYLAAAGVGRIGLVDSDSVDYTNLHRQLLYDTPSVGRPKLEVAYERLKAINPDAVIDLFETRLTSSNALEVIRSFDIVVDGTDNFPSRYLINDACVLLGTPNVHGSVFQFDGQVSTFGLATGPCYRCVFPTPPPPTLVPSCAESGVIGVLPGLIGMLQAGEALKLLLGIGASLCGRLLLVDALDLKFRELKIKARPDCPSCGTRIITALGDYGEFCSARAMDGAAHSSQMITAAELAERINRGDNIEIIDVREPYEWKIGQIPRARLIPLGQLAETITSIDANRPAVVYCKRGGRSSKAAAQLRAAGHKQVLELSGGIEAWVRDQHATMPDY